MLWLLSIQHPKLHCTSMPRFSINALLFAALLCTSASGQGLGVGIIAGNPTGISVKKWLCDGNAIDGAAAWSFDGHNAFQLHADYLWHHDFPSSRVPFYCGVGGRVGFDEGNRRHNGETRAGVRFPLGVTYFLERAPVDVFVEVVPVFDVAPRTDLELGAAVGIRYYFR
jgi:hypothetical protein